VCVQRGRGETRLSSGEAINIRRDGETQREAERLTENSTHTHTHTQTQRLKSGVESRDDNVNQEEDMK